MHELDLRLRDYEQANDSHLWKNVEPFVHSQATYFFTDGTFNGVHKAVYLGGFVFRSKYV